MRIHARNPNADPDVLLRAFSTLVADSQFSTLGVVLIAMLARVGRIVGLPEVEADPAGADANVKTLLVSSFRATGQQSGEAVLREYMEDVGKVVERSPSTKASPSEAIIQPGGASKRLAKASANSTEGGAVDANGQNATKTTVQEAAPLTSDTRPKKKRKKGNAIDDLFSNLI
jgi:ribonuclease MRP protein subunit RMP1